MNLFCCLPQILNVLDLFLLGDQFKDCTMVNHHQTTIILLELVPSIVAGANASIVYPDLPVHYIFVSKLQVANQVTRPQVAKIQGNRTLVSFSKDLHCSLRVVNLQLGLNKQIGRTCRTLNWCQTKPPMFLLSPLGAAGVMFQVIFFNGSYHEKITTILGVFFWGTCSKHLNQIHEKEGR